MTGAELINEARDFHTSFTPIKHQDTVLLRQLSRALKEFFAIVVKNGAEAALAKDLVFDEDSISEAMDGVPLTIPAYLKIVSGLVAADPNIYGMTIIQQDSEVLAAGFVARLVGRSMYLAQPEEFQDAMAASVVTGLRDETEWGVAQAIRLTYVPLPADLDDLDQDLQVSDDAKLYFIASLVYFMALRSSSGMPGEDRSALMGDANSMKADVLEQYMSRSSNETSWTITPE